MGRKKYPSCPKCRNKMENIGWMPDKSPIFACKTPEKCEYKEYDIYGRLIEHHTENMWTKKQFSILDVILYSFLFIIGWNLGSILRALFQR
jgi:hypothetical protein